MLQNLVDYHFNDEDSIDEQDLDASQFASIDEFHIDFDHEYHLGSFNKPFDRSETFLEGNTNVVASCLIQLEEYNCIFDSILEIRFVDYEKVRYGEDDGLSITANLKTLFMSNGIIPEHEELLPDFWEELHVSRTNTTQAKSPNTCMYFEDEVFQNVSQYHPQDIVDRNMGIQMSSSYNNVNQEFHGNAYNCAIGGQESHFETMISGESFQGNSYYRFGLMRLPDNQSYESAIKEIQSLKYLIAPTLYSIAATSSSIPPPWQPPRYIPLSLLPSPLSLGCLGSREVMEVVLSRFGPEVLKSSAHRVSSSPPLSVLLQRNSCPFTVCCPPYQFTFFSPLVEYGVNTLSALVKVQSNGWVLVNRNARSVSVRLSATDQTQQFSQREVKDAMRKVGAVWGNGEWWVEGRIK